MYPVSATLLFVILLAGVHVAGAAEPPDEFERRLDADLRARSVQAADLFAEANAAREKDDHARAAELYGRVFEMAPTFIPALRRQCGEVSLLGRRNQAIALCRRAVASEASAENFAMLSTVLVTPRDGPEHSAKADSEALGFASRAVDLKPDAPWTLEALCQVAMVANSLPALRRCVEGLQRVEPNAVVTHFSAMVLAASEGRFQDAQRSLTRARELGLGDEQYRELQGYLQDATPVTARLFPIAKWIGIVWIGGFALLLVVGWILSRVALRTAARVPTTSGGQSHGIDARLRRAYGIVLWLCCAYYYVSLPLVFLIVLVVSGGLIYSFLALGHVPIKLVALVVVIGGTTLWAMARSVFVRVADADPGTRLDLARHPKLAALLEEVAGAVKTRRVDSVYLTPGTDIAVMERGGILRQLSGRNERCLILGVGVLDGMRVGPFKAILAHEYGHLSNQDTAGGGFALAVRRSLVTMAHGLAASGAAAWYNPAWLFLNVFYRIFLRISQGASRLQEVLADRWAAAIYGATAFEQGLRHVIERSIYFDAFANASLKEVVDGKVPLANLYQHRPATPPPAEEIQQAVQAALSRPPSPYDSHPSPVDRFAWVRALPTQGTASSAGDEGEAWDLFGDRTTTEVEMTATIRQNLQASYDMEIPAS